MDLGIGLGLTMQLRRGRPNPFASLMSTLLSGASQLIAHPLDYGNMFQDRAGTTPVTAPGQQVGLVLDHGLTGKAPVLGPELVTNGGFDTDLTGWTNSGSWSWSGGAAVTTGTFGTLTQLIGGRNNAKRVIIEYVKTSFRLQLQLIDSTGVNATVSLGGVPDLSTLGASPLNTFIPAGYDTVRFITTDAGSLWAIYNISVRELPGYHATAISDAARGIYREVGGLRYIEYNGVNTAYQTPVLPAPGVDKVQVFSGLRKLSDAAAGVVLELSTSTVGSVGSFYLITAENTVSLKYTALGRGDASVNANQRSSHPDGPAPDTCVLTATHDIPADLSRLRRNGVFGTDATGDKGTGNFNPSGTYRLNYGARNGTSVFFNGYHYGTLGPIVRFGTNATEDQIAAAEAYYTEATGL